MHYSFKKKLNKIDSQQYRNLLVPEIDWTLNEAYEIFVKSVAMPLRSPYRLGAESNQRSIEDIRILIKNQNDPVNHLTVNNKIAILPSGYWYFMSAHALVSKGTCTNKKASIKVRQHDDEFEESYFDRSSFEWRSVNCIFETSGIRVFTDDTFEVNKLCLSYITKLEYIHNAEDFRGGTYNLTNGTTLTGTRNCPLPDHTHNEIIDIAVLIATGELQIPDYQIKKAKLDLNLN